jgi:hypothetical protein
VLATTHCQGGKVERLAVIVVTVVVIVVDLVALEAVTRWTSAAFGLNSSTPLPGRPDHVLPTLEQSQFDRFILEHYEEGHARTVRNFSSRYETKEDVLKIFIQYADKSKLETCRALTDVLIKGFCPKDLTEKIGDLDQNRGPWGTKNLNVWVKSIEDQIIEIRVSLEGEEIPLTKPVDWWILFCGAVEQYESHEAQACLTDWRSLGPLGKNIAQRGILQNPRPFITGTHPTWLPGTKNLSKYMKGLPDFFGDSHATYARGHVEFVQSLYKDWNGAERTSLSSNYRGSVEDYVRNLLLERGAKVLSLKTVDDRESNGP